MRILHLIRAIEDNRAVETAVRQRNHDHDVTLVLLHDAVFSSPSFEGSIFACKADLEARQMESKHTPVDYDAIVRMIFENDRVVSW